jgi:hypothetical protein
MSAPRHAPCEYFSMAGFPNGVHDETHHFSNIPTARIDLFGSSLHSSTTRTCLD